MLEFGYFVYVEVKGLELDCWYFYQFKVGGEFSLVGCICMVLVKDVMLDKFQFVFVFCQYFEFGYYIVYEYMLKEFLDLVVYFGDYIYEYVGKDN